MINGIKSSPSAFHIYLKFLKLLFALVVTLFSYWEILIVCFYHFSALKRILEFYYFLVRKYPTCVFNKLLDNKLRWEATLGFFFHCSISTTKRPSKMPIKFLGWMRLVSDASPRHCRKHQCCSGHNIWATCIHVRVYELFHSLCSHHQELLFKMRNPEILTVLYSWILSMTNKKRSWKDPTPRLRFPGKPLRIRPILPSVLIGQESYLPPPPAPRHHVCPLRQTHQAWVWWEPQVGDLPLHHWLIR